MISEVVARRYARALFNTTPELALDKIVDELKGVDGLFSSNAKLQALLESPSLSSKKKRDILDAVLSGANLSELTNRFMRLLLEKGRIDHLTSVIEHFSALVDDKMGRVNAQVVLAEDPGKKQEGKLVESLKSITGKSKIILHKRIDPSILGGVIIRIGDQIFDASVRNELVRIEKTLAE